MARVGRVAVAGPPGAPPSTWTPAASTTAPAPAPSATPEGDLATTGSAVGPGRIAAAVAPADAVGGGFLASAKRRRPASGGLPDR
ncbi:hypothetical protein GCM10010275_21840 [Streptomyces litmocidini]|uniref:hypothetical protein n=1 Tax=Streptomyces litmocidini TaxID=67318 RepID=UPI0019B892FD|nr:hypothetical protein [Streptomyces litmocidini]GGU86008.1 hypothetical protein GCM10010275_21840 [Streptomyces litmocidini]